jgi:hypothetical protein
MAQVEAAPPRRERNWDGYAAVIATLVGLMALLIASYTAYLQRKQARAQVWPRVEVMRYSGRLSFMAANRGVGPARVRAAMVLVDGKPIRRWTDMLQALGYQGPYSQGQISGRVLSPGQELDVFAAPNTEEGRKMFADVTASLFRNDARHKVGILLCYCSVFDDCWLAGLGKDNLRGVVIDDEREISRCPISADEGFRE